MPRNLRALAVLLAASATAVLLGGSSATARTPPAGVTTAPPAEPAKVIEDHRPRSRGQVIKDVLPSNVRIAVSVGGQPARSATGVVFATRSNEDGPVSWVLTNAHVVGDDAPQETGIEVLVDERAKTTRFPATVVTKGQVPDMDLAVLEVRGLRAQPAQLADDADIELGDDIIVVGAPFGKGLSISSGIVSQLEWNDGGAPRSFKTDAPIGYGASGGGIYRVPDGHLLALVEGYRTAKVSFPVAKRNYSFDVPMPGETFAAPVAKIRGFLRGAGLGPLLGGTTAAR
jgi:serine protease Do